ncbi:hypothetical protein [Pseudomonas sp. EL_65y_Pfl2_R96]|uniref:hypothetical protein n=1 Tax=Pseudomonas sp. EL_65y_Pfl2_R96 TaxID=3088699 RepID=UPI0030D7CE05
MNQKKNNTPWKEKHPAEKIGLLAGWAVIAAILWYWLTPSQTPPAEPPTNVIAEAPPPAAIHTFASAQALIDATLYLSQLDEAMAQGMPILKANTFPELGDHSQVFKALLETGQAQFGRSVFEPLGRCSSAGIFANSWWQAQVSAARQGGTESIPGAIQSSLDAYKINHIECLKNAAPS